jgi:hypothetical protein
MWVGNLFQKEFNLVMKSNVILSPCSVAPPPLDSQFPLVRAASMTGICVVRPVFGRATATRLKAVAARLGTVCGARLLPLLLLLSLPAVVQGQWQYTTNNGTITITGYTGSGGAVTIPSTITGRSVTSIREDAFSWYGYRLTSVTIPDSITNIGIGAFYRCTSLTAITVNTNNPAFSSVAGILFNHNQTALIQCPEQTAGSYTVPSSVTSIGYEAFAGCASLTNVTIPNSVTSVGDWAFSYSGLINITIPNSLINIGNAAFSLCASLTAITVDTGNPAYSGVAGVLFDHDQTTLVQCPGGETGAYLVPNRVTNVGSDAFCGCSSLTNVTVPEGVTSIGDEAFYGCSSLTNVDIPNSVTSIGDWAFYGCSALISVTIPNSTTQIGDYAFYFCTSLTNVTMGNNITSIGDWAFAYCTNLTSATIPASVISIGDYAFSNCSSLTDVTIHDNVTIPASVTSMGTNVFSYCPSLTNVTIGNSVTNIGDNAFYQCNSLTRVTIGNSVTTIGQLAFQDCNSLTSITIPDSVTSIGGYAFEFCSGLTSVTINSVTDIGMWAFRECYGLTNVTIGSGVSSIGNGAFYDCWSLTDVTIGNSVASIGSDAFGRCGKLTHLMFPSSVTNLGAYAFASCYLLKAVYFQGNAPSFGGSYVFDSYPIVFYLPGTEGWGPTFSGCPTALWFLPKPLVLNHSSSFGVKTNRFGFIISWATNIPVVVEACADLLSPTWSPVGTNTLTDGWSYFSDPQWTNYPTRLYRLRSP